MPQKQKKSETTVPVVKPSCWSPYPQDCTGDMGGWKSAAGGHRVEQEVQQNHPAWGFYRTHKSQENDKQVNK